MSRLHRPSIKLRVAVWYTVSVLAIMIFAGVFILNRSQNTSERLVDEKLRTVIIAVADYVHMDDLGLITIDVTAQQLCRAEGISLSLYNEKRQAIYGVNAFPPSVYDLEYKQLQTVLSDGVTYYIYDYEINDPLLGVVWIRGSLSLSSLQDILDVNVNVILFVFPFLIALALLGGYIIAKRAFNPIGGIISAANDISNGNDLNRRLPLPKHGSAEDEVYQLSITFNDMFDRLEKSFENEKQFTSNASHELRTPVSVIKSQSEYLLTISDTAEQREAISTILRQSDKMSRLIAELLMLTKADEGGLLLKIDELDFSELVDIVVEELQESAAQKDISIIPDIMDGMQLEADQTLIMRLIMNLISNAIKYGREGGWIKVTAYQESGYVYCDIQDNGIGISDEDLPKIWGRFYQVSASRSRHDGYGVGLSLVQMIVKAHGGSISAESKLGEGSLFSFSIPKKHQKIYRNK